MANPRNTKVLQNSAKEIILRVRAFCEAEKFNGYPIIPLQKVRSRVAAMTGISEKTVSRITKEQEKADNNSTSPNPNINKPGTKHKKDVKRLQDVKKKRTKLQEIQRLQKVEDEIKEELEETPLDPASLLTVQYMKEEYSEEERLEHEKSPI